MPKFRKPLTEDQEIEQEEREIKREYLIFVPLLLIIVLLIAFSLTRAKIESYPVELVVDKDNSGYWIVYSDGRIENFGNVETADKVGVSNESRIVDAKIAENGFWVMDQSGVITPVNGAVYAGSIDRSYDFTTAKSLINLPSGRAYRIVGLNGPVVNMNTPPVTGGSEFFGEVTTASSTATGEGYWIISPSGEVNPFGDAANFMDIDLAENENVVDSTPYGDGLAVVTSFGRVAVLGDGQHKGDLSDSGLSSPVIDIDATGESAGYRILTLDGKVTAFGDTN